MTTMKPTCDPADDRGIFSLLGTLTRAALARRQTSQEAASVAPAARGPGRIERFDRWISRARQRERERFLAGSRDVLELEQRIRASERMP